MNLIKPKNLKIGDKIGILATSGGIEDDKNLQKAKSFFNNRGYEVVFSSNVLKNDGYLAGSDNEKVEQLHKFFADDSINAIICLRGGYGAIRLINKIDYMLIRNNPKIFAGYSDITALSAIFLKRAGLITYSAPMIQSDFGDDIISDFTMNSFFDVVENEKVQNLKANKVYKKGNTSGITFGGNLSTIVSLCGQDFIPDEKFIFFAEDLCEPVYKIDKMFTQLFNIQQFKQNISGLILGDFLNVDNQMWLNSYFEDLSSNLDVPVLEGFKITHAKDKLTIPYGKMSAISENYFII